MNRFAIRICFAVAALGTMMSMPSSAAAQDVIHSVYGNRVAVRRVIQDVERESNSFRQVFEKRYHNMFIPNFRETDHARKAVQNLDKALEMARRKADNQKVIYVRDDVERVIEKARVVDMMFRSPDPVLATMRKDWADLREDINGLAQIYELPEVGS